MCAGVSTASHKPRCPCASISVSATAPIAMESGGSLQALSSGHGPGEPSVCQLCQRGNVPAGWRSRRDREEWRGEQEKETANREEESTVGEGGPDRGGEV